MKRTHLGRRFLALLLCLCLVLPLTQTASAEVYLTGQTVSVKINSSNVNWYLLSERVNKCTSFDIEIDVSMNYGTSCTNWNVWGRVGNKHEKLGTIYLPGGDGYTYTTIYMSPAKSFDAIAVTPTISGSYSWSMSIDADNFKCSSTSSSSSSGSSSSSSSSKTGILSGYWGDKMKIAEGGSTWNTYPFMFDTPVRYCTGISVELDVEMNYGATCRQWVVWGVKGKSYSRLGDLYLPDGDGIGSVKLTFRSAKNFDGIAITPKASGNYSFTYSITAYNAKY